MKLTEPVPLGLTFEWSSSVSAYVNWSDRDYQKGERVHDPISAGGDGLDYEATSYVESGSGRPSTDDKNWRQIGYSGGTNASFDTDAELTEYDTWTASSAVFKGAIQFDAGASPPADYVANEAIASGNNTIRPSVAVNHDTDSIRARWTRVGTANAFRMFDGTVLNRTRADTSITCIAVGNGLCDTVALLGLKDVSDVDVTVTAGEKIDNYAFTSTYLPWVGSFTHDTSNAQLDISTSDIYYPDMSLVPGRDYRLEINFTANTGTIRARILNADGTSTLHTASSSASSDTDFLLDFTATTKVCRIYLDTTSGTATLNSVSLKERGFISENLTASLEYGSTGRYRSVWKDSHQPVDTPQYSVTIASEYDRQEIQVGLMVAGTEETFGPVEQGLRDTTEDYSKVDFDETYGFGDFVKRGYSRLINATLPLRGDYDVDYVMQRIRDVRATPVLVEFNDGSMAFNNLICHGVFMRPEARVTGLPMLDGIQVEFMGLVE
jgi:hypothetical protein